MDRYRCLLGDLVAGVDDAAREGLIMLDRPDAAAARAAAEHVAERIEHILSVTSPARPVVPPVEKFAPDARIALGHAQELANRLAVEHDGVGALSDALEGIATAPGLAGRWRWQAIGVASRRIAGPFSFSREHRIISGTLAIVGDHVQRALSTIDAASMTAAAGAVVVDLGHATRALGRSATHDPVRRAFQPHVVAAIGQIEKLERAALLRGLGASPELGAVKTASRAVHAAVQLSAVVAAVFAL
ncbi:MAG TPA: hypothetical protein VM261_28055 [Kofleriaceae bacterium]|nr:hypothetical protein [Kofleriaceae bacterium]